MTARQVWEGMLTELSKTNAPSLLLHEFNYYFNKAINQYINKRYNIYDIHLQTTDDLRVLKATAVLDVKKAKDTTEAYKNIVDYADKKKPTLFGATYEVILPDDYLHMLNCICIYQMQQNHRCYDKGEYVDFAAQRLTADSWSKIINDYYHRPLPERPYYYIHNVNLLSELPTNKYSGNISGSTDQVWVGTEEPGNGYTLQSEFSRTIDIEGPKTTTAIEDVPGLRHANPSKVRCEIRYGRDSSVYELKKVLIDYVKAPLTIRLTKEQVDLTADTSLIMEFPDYVCQEIINELVTLVMARDADPRLQVQAQVTQSIANPAQQLAPQPLPQLRG